MLDTNIIISAALFPTSALAKNMLKIADGFDLVISTQVVEELWRVVKHKFPQKLVETENFLEHLKYELAYTPKEIDPDFFPHIRDPKDYPILAAAIIADVDVFLTGDEDFQVLDLERPEILKPADFVAKYMKE
jgi:putative PIN family toxin of toxin-antitoxin system